MTSYDGQTNVLDAAFAVLVVHDYAKRNELIQDTDGGRLYLNYKTISRTPWMDGDLTIRKVRFECVGDGLDGMRR